MNRFDRGSEKFSSDAARKLIILPCYAVTQDAYASSVDQKNKIERPCFDAEIRPAEHSPSAFVAGMAGGVERARLYFDLLQALLSAPALFHLFHL